ncbi:type II toxin-antitoxin system VapC family toxin [Sulfolobus sp. E11-6]|uniref:type II toxin-antitoxin system VapC family toxin n=1 Tax=Sulfolobus sp. E11-6 TaxID=2663020 RepID=UPI001297C3E2|nr:PIN domain-containing protein [Sulfolobus sp. E11-6]QGA69649.1 PIN domain-containing protein [Sulfolobus sp. E11-6]
MIILDTSFLYSFFNRKDANHKKAYKLMNDIISKRFGKPIIFEYVLDELLTLMTKQPFDYVKKVIDSIIQDYRNNTFQIVMLDNNHKVLFDILKLFKKINGDTKRNNKLSFTDCAILLVMLRKEIPYLASFDSGFDGILARIEDGIYELSKDKRHNLERILG